MTWNSDMEENNFTDKVFSRFTSHFSLKSAAFTLAEVLVTLGIIGVVSAMTVRSEEHTSELQSRGLISYAVFCLKKKKQL